MKKTSEERSKDSGWKEQFIEWLKLHNEIKYPYALVVGSIDKASELALRNNIISCGLWNVFDAAELGMLIDKVIKDTHFGMNYKSLSIILGKCWEYYDQFLKSISLSNIQNSFSQSDNGDIVMINRELLQTIYCDNSSIETIFINHYKRGFVLGNIMHRNRLKAIYYENYGEDIDEDDISDFIEYHCFEYEGKCYLPKAIVSQNIAEKIVDDIDAALGTNKIVFYSVLYSKYKEDFSSAIYDCDMFAEYLKYIFKGSQLFFMDGYLTFEQDANVNVREVVLNYLLEADRPCSKEEIYVGLKNYNPDDIEKILRNNTPEILGNSKFDYFHVEAAHFTDDDINRLNHICELMLDGNKYVTCIDLIEKIKTFDISIYGKLEDRFSDLGIRRILMYYLKFKFEVSTGIVSHKGNKMSVTDVFVDYAKNHDAFTVEDIIELTNITGTQPYWKPICMNSVRISQNNFVSDARFEVDVDAVDEVIALYCKEYLPIGAFDDFTKFPLNDYPWNRFLLYSYILRFSKKFKLVQLSYPSKERACGVVVNREYDYPDFDSVAYHLFCKKQFSTVVEAKEYMYQNGYIASRQYKNAERLLKKANAIQQ